MFEPEPIDLADGPLGLEPHLSPERAAVLLSLSVASIRRLERAGELHGVRLCGRLRFPASELRRYVAACVAAPRRTPPPELLAAGGRPKGRRRR